MGDTVVNWGRRGERGANPFKATNTGIFRKHVVIRLRVRTHLSLLLL